MGHRYAPRGFQEEILMGAELAQIVEYSADCGGFVDSSWEIRHEGCSMVNLAKRLEMTIEARLPTMPFKDNNLQVCFAVPSALEHNYVKELFKGLENNVQKAFISINERQDITFFDLRFRDKPIELLVSTPWMMIQSYRADSKQEMVDLRLPRIDLIEEVRKKVNEIGHAEISSMNRVENSELVNKELLGPEESRILATLVSNGFWDLPRRRTTLKDLAPKMGMSDTTLSLIVRDISGKVFDEYIKKMKL